MIDMGPEGGDAGGKVVGAGTPEQLARNSQSHTGRYIAKALANGNAHSGANGHHHADSAPSNGKPLSDSQQSAEAGAGAAAKSGTGESNSSNE
jgi:hypothetical protein